MLNRANIRGQISDASRKSSKHRLYIIVKRMLDILIALIGTVTLAPLMLVIAIAIRLDSPGPILSKQKRIGQWARPFEIYRFRTMIAPAEWPLEDVEVTVYKMRSDPRVTRFGRWLRRFSLDELPQLFNVIRGEMSLVGPRPALPYEVDHYDNEAALRLQAKPGITGLWQVNRSACSYEEMVQLDLEYVTQASLWLDLMILLKSVVAAFQGQGAY